MRGAGDTTRGVQTLAKAMRMVSEMDALALQEFALLIFNSDVFFLEILQSDDNHNHPKHLFYNASSSRTPVSSEFLD